MPSCTLSRPEMGEADVVSMLRRLRAEESETSRDEVVLALPVYESENITTDDTRDNPRTRNQKAVPRDARTAEVAGLSRVSGEGPVVDPVDVGRLRSAFGRTKLLKVLLRLRRSPSTVDSRAVDSRGRGRVRPEDADDVDEPEEKVVEPLDPKRPFGPRLCTTAGVWGEGAPCAGD
jgi:hypothetical protein